MFYVYIIESARNKRWYYGHTNHLDLRLLDHNSGRNVSTKNCGPWRFIFQRPIPTIEEAVKFEKHLKLTRNKRFIKNKYSEFFIE